MNLNRPIGVRISFVAVAIACYFATLAALAFAPTLEQAGTWSALEWLIGVIGIGVAGDTIRPSGQRMAAFVAPGVVPDPPTGSA